MWGAYVAIVGPPGSEEMRKIQYNKDNYESIVFVGSETQCFEVEDQQKNRAVILNLCQESHSRFSIHWTHVPAHLFTAAFGTLQRNYWHADNKQRLKRLLTKTELMCGQVLPCSH